MASRYEAVGAPRFTVAPVGGGEQIRIGAKPNIFLAAFLAVWLCGWTVGGFSAAGSLASRGFQPFLAFWLCGWALAEGFALLTLAWMFGGEEILSVRDEDLEVRAELLGFVRKRLYRGSEIRNLGVGSNLFFGRGRQGSLPIVADNRFGAVKFSYGARTIYLAAGLDETEGQLIVDRILARLPSAAR